MGQKLRGFFHSYGGGGGSRALPCPPQELWSQGMAGTRCLPMLGSPTSCSNRCLVAGEDITAPRIPPRWDIGRFKNSPW